MGVGSWFEECDDLAERSLNERARALEGSAILEIAGEVDAMRRRGVNIANLTVGDFAPSCFSIPETLKDRIKAALDAGHTNYPPAVGIPELRAAVRRLYQRDLGLDYPDGCVQIGSGARPPLYAAFATTVAPGDVVVYPVPSWNNAYYVYLARAQGVAVPTRPESGFLPTVEDLLPHLRQARLLCLCSPSNPTGTAFSREQLLAICEAVLDENHRRRAVGNRPLLVLYDQCYWQLTFAGHEHHTPVGLLPEMARYTLFVDAISKSWAATGLRVGWGVFPPWIRAKTAPLVGHMGAWAGRPEQHATASLLEDAEAALAFLGPFRATICRRLQRIRNGLLAMREEGLPVDALEAQGAIYLTARFDLLGRKLPDGRVLETDDDVRRLLLEEARVAVVPFTAFGLPHDTGWVRLSVGAVDDDGIDGALDRIRALLQRI